MAALLSVRNAGFSVALAGGSFEVTPASKITQSLREFLKSHKAEIIGELKAELMPASRPVVAAVYSYRTTEKPEALLTMVTQGKTLEEAHHILDNRYGGKLLSVESATLVKCFDCLNFQAINPHGKGAGHCSSGVQPSGVCFWAETTRQCESFSPKLVRCWTPEGAMIEVTAKDKAHAAFLAKMNPNPNKE